MSLFDRSTDLFAVATGAPDTCRVCSRNSSSYVIRDLVQSKSSTQSRGRHEVAHTTLDWSLENHPANCIRQSQKMMRTAQRKAILIALTRNFNGVIVSRPAKCQMLCIFAQPTGWFCRCASVLGLASPTSSWADRGGRGVQEPPLLQLS